MQSHTHANSLSEPGHVHEVTFFDIQYGTGGLVSGIFAPGQPSQSPTQPAVTGISITNATSGAGASQNVQPSIVSHLPLIKT